MFVACALVTSKNSISLSDFYFLNPELNANCTNLWAGKCSNMACLSRRTTSSLTASNHEHRIVILHPTCG